MDGGAVEQARKLAFCPAAKHDQQRRTVVAGDMQPARRSAQQHERHGVFQYRGQQVADQRAPAGAYAVQQRQHAVNGKTGQQLVFQLQPLQVAERVIHAHQRF